MSVERTIVFRPRSAHRMAVAAATLVLPTPPLPVYRTIRVTRACLQKRFGWGRAMLPRSERRACFEPGALRRPRPKTQWQLVEPESANVLPATGTKRQS